MSFKQLPFTYVELYVYMHAYIHIREIIVGEKKPLYQDLQSISLQYVTSNMIYTTNGLLLNILQETRLSQLVQSAHLKF